MIADSTSFALEGTVDTGGDMRTMGYRQPIGPPWDTGAVCGDHGIPARDGLVMGY